MTRTTYYTAMTFDGFIADPDDSLDWLFRQDQDTSGPLNYEEFIVDVGAIVMGATTYLWVLEHLERTGERWSYAMPAWVMTHRSLPALPGADVHFASGDVHEVHGAMTAAAGGKGLWVVGGGDLAGQFADAGLLDEVVAYVAPVTLGSGRQVLPRRLDLELLSVERNRAFVVVRYRCLGPLTEDR